MKKTTFLACVFFAGLSSSAFGQGWLANSATNSLNGYNSTLGLTPLKVGIGTAAPSVQLHTTEGVRFAGLTNNDAVTRIIGSDANGNLFWRNAASLLNTAWLTNGNLGTNPANNFVGTRDAQPLVFKTNNIEQMRITTASLATGIGVVEVGQSASSNGNLSIWGKDITGYSHPFHISSDITGADFDTSMSPLPGSGSALHTMGRMLRLNQVNGGVTTNAYDMGIDMNGNLYITDKTLAGARLQKRAIVVANNNVGINFGMSITGSVVPDPTANFHTMGTVRHEGLTIQNGTMLVVDPAGNVFNSGLPANGGVTSTCNTANMVPVVTSGGSSALGCSQIYDDLQSVGINKTAGFGYISGSASASTVGAPATQAVRLDVNGLVRSISYVATSDAKFKKDVTPLKESLENIMKLKPVEYNWKTQEYHNMGFDNLKHSGFIAQELAGILPNSVIKDNEGNYAVDYNSIIPVLTQAIQQQQSVINDKSNKLEALEKRLAKLEAGSLDVASKKNIIAGAELYQNVPNPFAQTTTISYKLPGVYNSAKILIFDMNGKQMRDILLNSTGEITLQANELMPGMYLYSLIIDGAEVDTKRMILTNN